MVVAALAAALTFACGRPDDTEEMVRDALDQANFGEIDVELDRTEQTFHLTGTVETLADRVRAQELAAAIVGTTGQVENDITVEGLGVIEPRRHP